MDDQLRYIVRVYSAVFMCIEARPFAALSFFVIGIGRAAIDASSTFPKIPRIIPEVPQQLFLPNLRISMLDPWLIGAPFTNLTCVFPNKFSKIFTVFLRKFLHTIRNLNSKTTCQYSTDTTRLSSASTHHGRHSRASQGDPPQAGQHE